MPILAGLMFAIQIGLAVHAVKTGRETFWVYLIIMVPVIGASVYVFTQLMPDMMANRSVRQAARKIDRAVNPHKDVRRLRDQVALADNMANRLALADACLEAELDREASDLYERCLQGPYRHDPHVLLKLARARFRLGQPADTRQLLERLIEHNPDFQSADGHLLYARALEELDDIDAALGEYAVLADSYPGEEGRIRYALLLQAQGQAEKAFEQYRHTLLRCKRSPPYYRQSQRRWINIAKEKLG